MMENSREGLMYKIMGSLYDTQAPIVFKGALITKLLLEENGSNLQRETQDIDANWIGQPPTMEKLVETINISLSKLKEYDLKAIAYRDYGQKRSAGIRIVEQKINREILKMDIDIKPIKESRTYWYGDLTFKGTTVTQIMTDKISSLSNEKLFRRVKDMVDVYALSQCISIKTKEVFDIAKETGRTIGDFSTFFSRVADLEYAYNKLKGVENKPDFNKMYPELKVFVEPFAKKENMIWNNKEQIWNKENSKNQLSLNSWKEQIQLKKQEAKNNQQNRNREYER